MSAARTEFEKVVRTNPCYNIRHKILPISVIGADRLLQLQKANEELWANCRTFFARRQFAWSNHIVASSSRGRHEANGQVAWAVHRGAEP